MMRTIVLSWYKKTTCLQLVKEQNLNKSLLIVELIVPLGLNLIRSAEILIELKKINLNKALLTWKIKF